MTGVPDGNGNTFTGDSDRCSDLDPSTGTNILRYLNIIIACDKNAKTLVVDKYTERGQCNYYIVSFRRATPRTQKSQKQNLTQTLPPSTP